jgi:hypothetical protein
MSNSVESLWSKLEKARRAKANIGNGKAAIASTVVRPNLVANPEVSSLPSSMQPLHSEPLETSIDESRLAVPVVPLQPVSDSMLEWANATGPILDNKELSDYDDSIFILGAHGNDASWAQEDTDFGIPDFPDMTQGSNPLRIADPDHWDSGVATKFGLQNSPNRCEPGCCEYLRVLEQNWSCPRRVCANPELTFIRLLCRRPIDPADLGFLFRSVVPVTIRRLARTSAPWVGEFSASTRPRTGRYFGGGLEVTAHYQVECNTGPVWAFEFKPILWIFIQTGEFVARMQLRARSVKSSVNSCNA